MQKLLGYQNISWRSLSNMIAEQNIYKEEDKNGVWYITLQRVKRNKLREWRSDLTPMRKHWLIGV